MTNCEFCDIETDENCSACKIYCCETCLEFESGLCPECEEKRLEDIEKIAKSKSYEEPEQLD